MVTRINRAAWQRIKARLESGAGANGARAAYDAGRPGPRTATFFKARSVGATAGMIENLRRFGIENLFAPSSGLSSAIAGIEARVERLGVGATDGLRDVDAANERVSLTQGKAR